MEKSKKIFKISLGVLVLTCICLVFYYFFPVVFAWIGPTQNPPGGNVSFNDSCSNVFEDWCSELDYSGQAEVIYDDYRKGIDSEYTRPLVSTWTQTSSVPEIWKDERTGLYWTDQQGTATTNDFTISTCDFYSMARGAYTGGDTDCDNAINRCADLNGTSHGGRTGWYLPSKHELMQAYLDGMYIQTNENFTVGTGWVFWSSSEVSSDSSAAWLVILDEGFANYNGKLETITVRCVSRDLPPCSAEMDIGTRCGGGILAYHDGSGGGLIASAADNSTGVQWGCFGTEVGASGTAIGTGASNTSAILSGCATRPIAASVCSTSAEGGKTDWFLPSRDELDELYTNREAIEGSSEFTGAYYWSSSEQGTALAWDQYFANGAQNYGIKPNTSRVRCVRAF